MKKGSTLFLKIVLIFIGIVLLTFLLFTFPYLFKQGDVLDYRPILAGMHISIIPFIFALYQAWNLLTYIDKNTAFSDLSVKALKNIKYSVVLFGALYALGSPYVYFVADLDDAPGVVAIAIVVIGASVVVATFAAVLQKLVQNGVDLKSENDLTV